MSRQPTHQELIELGPAVLEGSRYKDLISKTEGTDAIPDAYPLLAGFGAKHLKDVKEGRVVCARSLYKRALTQDDPVRFY